MSTFRSSSLHVILLSLSLSFAFSTTYTHGRIDEFYFIGPVLIPPPVNMAGVFQNIFGGGQPSGAAKVDDGKLAVS